MVEPFKITKEMIDKRQEKKDEIMEHINKKIAEAVERGWNETNFDCYDDNLYDEIKREYINAGYRVYPNIYARCGGRNDFIAW